VFFAILRCSAHFKSKLRCNSWRETNKDKLTYELNE